MGKRRQEPILPPAFRKLPGKPKILRRKNKDEVKKGGKLSRQGRIVIKC